MHRLVDNKSFQKLGLLFISLYSCKIFTLVKSGHSTVSLNHPLSFSWWLFCVCVWSGPAAKKMKKGEFKPKKGQTEEELTQNRQQKKKELKKTRQLAERKDMFQIICQAKQVWGDLRRYTCTCTRTHMHSHAHWLAFFMHLFIFIFFVPFYQKIKLCGTTYPTCTTE